MDATNPAAYAIRLLGAKRIAAYCNLTTDAVWKWAKREGGTIPSRYQRPILELARAEGKALTAADVIGLSAAEAAAGSPDREVAR